MSMAVAEACSLVAAASTAASTAAAVEVAHAEEGDMVADLLGCRRAAGHAGQCCSRRWDSWAWRLAVLPGHRDLVAGWAVAAAAAVAAGYFARKHFLEQHPRQCQDGEPSSNSW